MTNFGTFGRKRSKEAESALGPDTSPSLPRRKLLSRLSFGHVVMICAGLLAFSFNMLILRGRDETTPVLVADRQIAAGDRLSDTHLGNAQIAADGPLADRLLAPDQTESLLGLVVIRDIAAGAPLFSDDFLWEQTPEPGRSMSIPIEPGNAVAADLRPGDRVDVVSVVEGEGGFAARQIEVLSVAVADRGGLSAGSDFSVTVAVDEATALSIAEALSQGNVYLVRSTGAALHEPTPPLPTVTPAFPGGGT